VTIVNNSGVLKYKDFLGDFTQKIFLNNKADGVPTIKLVKLDYNNQKIPNNSPTLHFNFKRIKSEVISKRVP